MIFTTRLHIKILAIIFFTTLSSTNSFAGICYLDDGTIHSDCEILKDADKELNKIYKSLVDSLSKKEENALKSSQRNWIKWRDRSCEKSVEKSGGKELSCESNNYNSCMSSLTKMRNSELLNFKNNIPAAALKRYSFATKK
jgi:uncharacterized protein YecT (DUF1311 family)